MTNCRRLSCVPTALACPAGTHELCRCCLSVVQSPAWRRSAWPPAGQQGRCMGGLCRITRVTNQAPQAWQRAGAVRPGASKGPLTGVWTSPGCNVHTELTSGTMQKGVPRVECSLAWCALVAAGHCSQAARMADGGALATGHCARDRSRPTGLSLRLPIMPRARAHAMMRRTEPTKGKVSRAHRRTRRYAA